MLVSALSENIKDRLEQPLASAYILYIRIKDSKLYLFLFSFILFFRLRISI